MISSGSFGGPCTNKQRVLRGYLGIVWGNCLVADGQLTAFNLSKGLKRENGREPITAEQLQITT